MNAVNLTLSLMFLVLVILAISLYFSWNLRPRFNRMVTWKINRIVALAFLGLLIIFVPIAAILNNSLLKSGDSRLKIVDLAVADQDISHIEFPPEEDLDEYPGVYKSNSQTFPLSSNKLEITGLENIGHYQVLIKRKETNDGELAISNYTAPHYTNLLDYTKMIAPPRITLDNGVLSIEAIEQNFSFLRYTPNFIIDQFKSEYSENRNMPMRFSVMGWRAIVLNVPKDLEITFDEEKLNIVIQD